MKKKKIIILCIIAAIIICGVIGVTIFKSNIEKNLKQLTTLKISNIDMSKIADGTYKGSYDVFPVAAEVEVILEKHKITGIRLLKHRNGQGKPAEVIPNKVMESQTTDIDIVSGATYSSKVILKAIEKALISGVK